MVRGKRKKPGKKGASGSGKMAAPKLPPLPPPPPTPEEPDLDHCQTCHKELSSPAEALAHLHTVGHHLKLAKGGPHRCLYCRQDLPSVTAFTAHLASPDHKARQQGVPTAAEEEAVRLRAEAAAKAAAAKSATGKYARKDLRRKAGEKLPGTARKSFVPKPTPLLTLPMPPPSAHPGRMAGWGTAVRAGPPVVPFPPPLHLPPPASPFSPFSPTPLPPRHMAPPPCPLIPPSTSQAPATQTWRPVKPLRGPSRFTLPPFLTNSDAVSLSRRKQLWLANRDNPTKWAYYFCGGPEELERLSEPEAQVLYQKVRIFKERHPGMSTGIISREERARLQTEGAIPLPGYWLALHPVQGQDAAGPSQPKPSAAGDEDEDQWEGDDGLAPPAYLLKATPAALDKRRRRWLEHRDDPRHWSYHFRCSDVTALCSIPAQVASTVHFKAKSFQKRHGTKTPEEVEALMEAGEISWPAYLDAPPSPGWLTERLRELYDRHPMKSEPLLASQASADPSQPAPLTEQAASTRGADTEGAAAASSSRAGRSTNPMFDLLFEQDPESIRLRLASYAENKGNPTRWAYWYEGREADLPRLSPTVAQACFEKSVHFRKRFGKYVDEATVEELVAKGELPSPGYKAFNGGPAPKTPKTQGNSDRFLFGDDPSVIRFRMQFYERHKTHPWTWCYWFTGTEEGLASLSVREAKDLGAKARAFQESHGQGLSPAAVKELVDKGELPTAGRLTRRVPGKRRAVVQEGGVLAPPPPKSSRREDLAKERVDLAEELPSPTPDFEGQIIHASPKTAAPSQLPSAEARQSSSPAEATQQPATEHPSSPVASQTQAEVRHSSPKKAPADLDETKLGQGNSSIEILTASSGEEAAVQRKAPKKATGSRLSRKALLEAEERIQRERIFSASEDDDQGPAAQKRPLPEPPKEPRAPPPKVPRVGPQAALLEATLGMAERPTSVPSSVPEQPRVGLIKPRLQRQLPVSPKSRRAFRWRIVKDVAFKAYEDEEPSSGIVSRLIGRREEGEETAPQEDPDPSIDHPPIDDADDPAEMEKEEEEEIQILPVEPRRVPLVDLEPEPEPESELVSEEPEKQLDIEEAAEAAFHEAPAERVAEASSPQAVQPSSTEAIKSEPAAHPPSRPSMPMAAAGEAPPGELVEMIGGTLRPSFRDARDREMYQEAVEDLQRLMQYPPPPSEPKPAEDSGVKEEPAEEAPVAAVPAVFEAQEPQAPLPKQEAATEEDEEQPPHVKPVQRLAEISRPIITAPESPAMKPTQKVPEEEEEEPEPSRPVVSEAALEEEAPESSATTSEAAIAATDKLLFDSSPPIRAAISVDKVEEAEMEMKPRVALPVEEAEAPHQDDLQESVPMGQGAWHSSEEPSPSSSSFFPLAAAEAAAEAVVAEATAETAQKRQSLWEVVERERGLDAELQTTLAEEARLTAALRAVRSRKLVQRAQLEGLKSRRLALVQQLPEGCVEESLHEPSPSGRVTRASGRRSEEVGARPQLSGAGGGAAALLESMGMTLLGSLDAASAPAQQLLRAVVNRK